MWFIWCMLLTLLWAWLTGDTGEMGEMGEMGDAGLAILLVMGGARMFSNRAIKLATPTPGEFKSSSSIPSSGTGWLFAMAAAFMLPNRGWEEEGTVAGGAAGVQFMDWPNERSLASSWTDGDDGPLDA
jgi:hypothetical protein